MDHTKLFTSYAQAVNQQGYPVTLGNLSDDLPVAALLVSLSNEAQQAGIQLVAYFLGDLERTLAALQQAQTAGGAPEQPATGTEDDYLQLFIRFPFEVAPQALPDLARLIHMINWSTPVGVFGMQEQQGMVYYRHIFRALQSTPSTADFVEAVDQMAYYSQLRFALLQSIASGKQSLDSLLIALDAAQQRTEVFPGYDS